MAKALNYSVNAGERVRITIKPIRFLNFIFSNMEVSHLMRRKRAIAANLAMKAKNYDEVISSLDSLDDLGRENFVDAAVMKANAYQKTHHTTAAIQLLNSIKIIKVR